MTNEEAKKRDLRDTFSRWRKEEKAKQEETAKRNAVYQKEWRIRNKEKLEAKQSAYRARSDVKARQSTYNRARYLKLHPNSKER